MLSIGLCACGDDNGGNDSDVQIINVPSEIYSQAEIDSAIQIIKNDFAAIVWHGCTLKELYDAGDSITKDAQNVRLNTREMRLWYLCLPFTSIRVEDTVLIRTALTTGGTGSWFDHLRARGERLLII